MKTMKRISSCILIAVMMLCCLNVQQVEAKTVLSKSQINSKITTLKKDIKKLNKQYNAAVKKEKKAQSGTTPIVLGKIISRNPYIVQSSFLDNSYYWVLNPGNMTDLLTIASGYVIPTGNYRTYNGITCVECKAKKVTIKSTGIKKKLDKKETALKKYQNALKEKIKIYENDSIYVGDTQQLSWGWTYGGNYNKVTWTSSNKSIATVNSKGVVTGKKAGTVTITAKCSASGKKTSTKIEILEDGGIAYPTDEMLINGIGKEDSFVFWLGNINLDEITVTSNNTDVANIKNVQRAADEDYEEDGITWKGYAVTWESVGYGTSQCIITDGDISVTVYLACEQDDQEAQNEND